MTKKTSDRREPEATPTSVREPRRHSHADSTEFLHPTAFWEPRTGTQGLSRAPFVKASRCSLPLASSEIWLWSRATGEQAALAHACGALDDDDCFGPAGKAIELTPNQREFRVASMELTHWNCRHPLLPMSIAQAQRDAELIERLITVRGIGRWTAEMYLMTTGPP